MLANYIKIALRTLWRHKGFSTINVAGLACGLACCLLLAGFIYNELSFESGHANRENIYRINGQMNAGDSRITMANVFPNLAPIVKETMPEVREVVRIRSDLNQSVEIGDIRFKEPVILYAEPGFFSIFTMPLRTGNFETALNAPFSVIISDKAARTYFPDEDPLGRTIRYMDQYDFRVTGVLSPYEYNSQLNVDFIYSYASLSQMSGKVLESWTDLFLDYTYVLLADGTDPAVIETRLPALLESHAGPEVASQYQLWLTPLTEIYLHSKLSYELPPQGSLNHIYMFSAITLVILLIACANFINLTTARTSHRLKEVGVRKVLGAVRGQLMRQFLSESIILTVIAMLIGLWLYELAKPEMEAYIGRPLTIGLLNNAWMTITMVGLILAVGILAGGYPAFLLSRHRPISILKGGGSRRTSKSILRKFLVVFQFTLAIVLVCGTLIIFKQIDYAASTDLGFARENVVIIEMNDPDIPREKLWVLKSELLTSPVISAAAVCGNVPGGGGRAVYLVRPENATTERPVLIDMMNIDENFLGLFEIPLLSGRALTDDDAGPSPKTILVNRAATEAFAMETPEGFRFLRSRSEMTVVGVVENFHNLSLHDQISPVALSIVPADDDLVAAKIVPGQTARAIAHAEAAWKRILPDYPFSYAMLEDLLSANYEREQKVASLFIVFTFLAVFIAGLGIFGLAAYSSEQRTREFSIRKVLGASVGHIVRLLVKEFLWLVLAASLIAWPVAYYLSSRWLERFAYRTDLSWWTFVAAGLLTLAIAFATSGFHAIRAALANPVDTLKYE